MAKKAASNPEENWINPGDTFIVERNCNGHNYPIHTILVADFGLKKGQPGRVITGYNNLDPKDCIIIPVSDDIETILVEQARQRAKRLKNTQIMAKAFGANWVRSLTKNMTKPESMDLFIKLMDQGVDLSPLFKDENQS